MYLTSSSHFGAIHFFWILCNLVTVSYGKFILLVRISQIMKCIFARDGWNLYLYKHYPSSWKRQQKLAVGKGNRNSKGSIWGILLWFIQNSCYNYPAGKVTQEGLKLCYKEP